MSAFSSRTPTYKAGVVLLMFMYVLFLVGYGSPYWSSAELDFGEVAGVHFSFHDGIWMLCVTTDAEVITFTGCEYFDWKRFPVWFYVVRALGMFCIAGMLFSVIYTFITNCCRTFPGPRTRILEICALLSGLLGFVGCMVYLGMRNDKDADDNKASVLDYLTLFLNLDWDFKWAFYLATIGSGMCVVAAIVIAVGNKPVEAPPATGGMVMTPVTAQAGYAPQPCNTPGDYPGAVPKPYVAQPGYSHPGYSQPGYSPDKAGYPAVQ